MKLFKRKKLKSVKKIDVVGRAVYRYIFVEKGVDKLVTILVSDNTFHEIYDIRMRVSSPIYLEVAEYLRKNVR